MNRRLRNRELQVRRQGVEESLWDDMYHRLMRLSWTRFFLLVSGMFIAINLVFAAAFCLTDGVANIARNDFFSCFFFSVETFATIGYGYFYPQTFVSHLIVIVEAATGIFSTAVLTGLIFSKFARPSARIVFSENILWTTQNGKPVLTLRLGNVRTNRIFEGRARVALLRDEMTSEGEKLRRVVDLKLIRNDNPLFALSWLIFHVIDTESPLFGVPIEDMKRWGWEIYATFSGLDQDMAQTVVAHTTYSAEQIIRAKKFVDMIHVLEDGTRVIDFSKLHEIEP